LKIFIHIGLPKCGSTSLQRFFAGRKEIFFAGKGHKRTYVRPELSRVIRVNVAGLPDILFDPDPCAEIVRQSLDEARDGGFDSYILSDEILSGLGFAYALRQRPEVSQITGRLVQLFGEDITFVVVIRNQLDLLRSYWNTLVLNGYPLSFSTFIDAQLCKEADVGSEVSLPHASILPYLRYDNQMKLLRASGHNVMVATLEQLVSDVTSFTDFVQQFGIRCAGTLPHVNSALPNKSYRRKFIQNIQNIAKLGLYTPLGEWRRDRQARSPLQQIGLWRSLNQEFSERQRESLQRYFAASNRELGLQLGLHLAALGFPT
jgi:hypothetical protein